MTPAVRRAARLAARLAAIAALLLLVAMRQASEASITLEWDPSPGPGVVGYRIYVGTEQGLYTQTYDVPADQTWFVYADSKGGVRYYFAVAAWARGDLLSELSDEVTGIAQFSRTEPEPEPTDPIVTPAALNVAATAAGAIARASSFYSAGYAPAAAINGDRSGLDWGGGAGGWNDATPDGFPDWLEVEFNGTYSVSRIDVFSVQDAYWAPSVPTNTTSFTRYGLTTFDLQYWTGSAWATVPGGTITGNTLVWRSVSFPPVSTTKIRVFVHQALDHWSRITEIEVYANNAVPPPPRTGVNVAAAAAGAVARASTYSSGYAPAGAIDGDRKGLNWGAEGGWNDATPDGFPDWLEVEFNGTYSVNRIDVFSVQDNYLNPVEPTATTAFANYGLTTFDLQYWTGSAWAAVAGGSITGNTLVWRSVSFAPVTTSKIRVFVHQARDQWSRVTEIEAFRSEVAGG